MPASQPTMISLPQPHLLALPHEICLACARHVLAMDLPAALRLRLVCSDLRASLELIRAAAEERRLRWRPELTMDGTISNSGRTLSMGDSLFCWAMCGPLPVAGKSAWKLRIERSAGSENGINVGVCDLAGLNTWFVNTHNAMVLRRHRRHSRSRHIKTAPLPDGYPEPTEGRALRLTPTDAILGCVLQVAFDHDAGTLSFGVGEAASPTEALGGFPKGAALRPCVILYGGAIDRVSLVGALGT